MVWGPAARLTVPPRSCDVAPQPKSGPRRIEKDWGAEREKAMTPWFAMLKLLPAPGSELFST